MTLNIWEDPAYVLLLGYKGTDTLIKRSVIHELFNKPRVFIPNVDGILCNNKGTIISPTRLWMKWSEIRNWVLEANLLEVEYKDSSKEEIPNDTLCRFYNEEFLVFRQAECIHWLMYSKYVIKNNKESYNIFMDSYGSIKQFGKNYDRTPNVQDFVNYIDEVGHSLGMSKAIEPHFMTILVKLSELRKVVNDLVSNNEYTLDKIHPSIKHLFNETKTVESKSSSRRKVSIPKKD